MAWVYREELRPGTMSIFSTSWQEGDSISVIEEAALGSFQLGCLYKFTRFHDRAGSKHQRAQLKGSFFFFFSVFVLQVFDSVVTQLGLQITMILIID